MKHWHIDDIDWARFDRAKLTPDMLALAKSAAMVERNGGDYGAYLHRVFKDDPEFKDAADLWAQEEVQHGDVLGRWAMLADPSWDYQDSFRRYREGYDLPLHGQETSTRGSRSGELIARCIVESGTSSYYSALADSAEEPVFKQICRHIAADEFRHYKLFYDYLRRYLEHEKIGFWGRLRIALGRVTESEDDELAFAYHCSNEPAEMDYAHTRCLAGYMSRAMAAYQPRHWQRGFGMILKAIGIAPNGTLGQAMTRLSWAILRHRRRRYAALAGGA
jgi:rubrerythrin